MRFLNAGKENHLKTSDFAIVENILELHSCLLPCHKKIDAEN